MVKSNFNAKAAKAAQSVIAQAKAEEVAKRAEEFIKSSDLEFGSFFYAQAQWLKKKGYDSLFDTDIKWALVLKRLAIAQPAAEVAAEAIAKFLGGSVSKGKEEFSAPVITFMGGVELRLFDAVQAIESKEDDAEEILIIKKELKKLWNDWMNLTVPSFKRILQYNLFPEVKDLRKLALKALCMSTGQVNSLIDRNRGEFFRSYAAPVDRGDYKLAALAAKEQSRDHEKVEEALAKMSEDELERHLIAEAIDTAFKVASKGQEYKSLAFIDGIPVAPTESDLVKGTRAVLEEAGWEWNGEVLTKTGWSWDYVLNFYAHLVGKHIDAVTAAQYCGLIDILTVNGFDVDCIESLAEEAVKGVLDNPNRITKLAPTAKRRVSVKAGGKTVFATSILHAMYLVAADMAGKFSCKGGSEILTKATDNLAYAKAVAKEAPELFAKREKALMKKFIRIAFTADAIACMPDGDLSWVTMPVYSAGPDKYLNYVNTHLGMDVSGAGENLYGIALAEVRDEIRAARANHGEVGHAEDVVTKLKFGHLTLDDIKNIKF